MIMLIVQEYSTTSEIEFMIALERSNAADAFEWRLVRLNVLNAEHSKIGDVGNRKKNNKDSRGVPSWYELGNQISIAKVTVIQA